ncbi:cytochrome c-type biogenesis protein CcmF [Methanohalophilus levihalophilus]|uniref:cytochrome c biogenesis protein CcsA n=1 Tax=Methanohalophilus levihalophilus TaxID=1431282 RepID=UPI001AE734CA|nr:cytochrome c biogenesis protein CcsA [Methanohalophilus levihalophilus]MBP2029123.1 cytochrome c-type biogenesis protein CcmF [Methanohalophilus levihalophilus]
MNFGMVFIWVSFILALGAAVLSSSYAGKFQNKQLSGRLEIAAFSLISLACILILYYLNAVNASYAYVYQHSSLDLQWYYRLSAMWAGQQGSLLLWVWGISAILLIIKYKSKNLPEKLMEHTRTISFLIISVFLLVLVLDNPFAVYYAKAQSIAVSNWNPFVHAYHLTDGQGMNPLLRNPWMAVHPPVLFMGYAAFTIPFAAAISGMLLNDDGWKNIAGNWMRVGWLFLTAGIGLGGFWAYEVLGWGAWYWSWDPVETSSLIPWIASTAYLHTQYSKKEAFRFTAPLLSVYSFILVVFATFVTRSGMWVSVHSWQDFTAESLLIGLFLVTITVSSTYLLAKRYFEEQR